MLANNQRLSPRTKYFCIKHHFFWSHVYHEEKNPDGYLVIVKCPTELMNADYLTKGLGRQVVGLTLILQDYTVENPLTTSTLCVLDTDMS